MTTLDRLYKKGLLTRARRGHAHVYTPVMSRAEFHATVARHVLTWLRVGDSYAAFFSDSTSSATRSDTLNKRSVTPAAIAGVTRSDV
jgi:predicted transcriptional regulator